MSLLFLLFLVLLKIAITTTVTSSKLQDQLATRHINYWRSIRVTPFFTPSLTDIRDSSILSPTTKEQVLYLYNNVIPAVISFLNRNLRVPRFVGTVYCAECKTYCGITKVPTLHKSLNRNLNFGSTDIIFYITHVTCEDGVDFDIFSQICSRETRTGQPIVASIGWCSSTTLNADTIRLNYIDYVNQFLREFIHVLFFDIENIEYFDSLSNFQHGAFQTNALFPQRTNASNSISLPIKLIPNILTLSRVSIDGFSFDKLYFNLTYLPKTTVALQEHFSCVNISSRLRNVLPMIGTSHVFKWIENVNEQSDLPIDKDIDNSTASVEESLFVSKSISVLYAFFDPRLVRSEILSLDFATGEFSNITVSFAEDSGWYKFISSSHSQLLSWGYQAGCDFFNDKLFFEESTYNSSNSCVTTRYGGRPEYACESTSLNASDSTSYCTYSHDSISTCESGSVEFDANIVSPGGICGDSTWRKSTLTTGVNYTSPICSFSSDSTAHSITQYQNFDGRCVVVNGGGQCMKSRCLNTTHLEVLDRGFWWSCDAYSDTVKIAADLELICPNPILMCTGGRHCISKSSYLTLSSSAILEMENQILSEFGHIDISRNIGGICECPAGWADWNCGRLDEALTRDAFVTGYDYSVETNVHTQPFTIANCPYGFPIWWCLPEWPLCPRILTDSSKSADFKINGPSQSLLSIDGKYGCLNGCLDYSGDLFLNLFNLSMSYILDEIKANTSAYLSPYVFHGKSISDNIFEISNIDKILNSSVNNLSYLEMILRATGLFSFAEYFLFVDLKVPLIYYDNVSIYFINYCNNSTNYVYSSNQVRTDSYYIRSTSSFNYLEILLNENKITIDQINLFGLNLYGADDFVPLTSSSSNASLLNTMNNLYELVSVYFQGDIRSLLLTSEMGILDNIINITSNGMMSPTNLIGIRQDFLIQTGLSITSRIEGICNCLCIFSTIQVQDENVFSVNLYAPEKHILLSFSRYIYEVSHASNVNPLYALYKEYSTNISNFDADFVFTDILVTGDVTGRYIFGGDVLAEDSANLRDEIITPVALARPIGSHHYLYVITLLPLFILLVIVLCRLRLKPPIPIIPVETETTPPHTPTPVPSEPENDGMSFPKEIVINQVPFCAYKQTVQSNSHLFHKNRNIIDEDDPYIIWPVIRDLKYPENLEEFVERDLQSIPSDDENSGEGDVDAMITSIEKGPQFNPEESGFLLRGGTYEDWGKVFNKNKKSNFFGEGWDENIDGTKHDDITYKK